MDTTNDQNHSRNFVVVIHQWLPVSNIDKAGVRMRARLRWGYSTRTRKKTKQFRARLARLRAGHILPAHLSPRLRLHRETGRCLRPRLWLLMTVT